MVIYEQSGAALIPYFNEKAMAGLGRDLSETGRLSPTGSELALQTFHRFRAITASLNIKNVRAVATAAVREASDGPEFKKRAEAILGAPIKVLSGADEGRLSAVGVSIGFLNPKGLIADLGGTSMELRPVDQDAVAALGILQYIMAMLMADAPLMHRLSNDSPAAPSEVTQAYIAIGDTLSLDRLRAAAEQAISDMPYWDRLATRGLTRELEGLQAEATKLSLKAESVDVWSRLHDGPRRELLQDLKKYTGSQPSFAQFALAADAVRKFVQVAS